MFKRGHKNIQVQKALKIPTRTPRRDPGINEKGWTGPQGLNTKEAFTAQDLS
jgi:hypothetical protein